MRCQLNWQGPALRRSSERSQSSSSNVLLGLMMLLMMIVDFCWLLHSVDACWLDVEGPSGWWYSRQVDVVCKA